MNIPKTIIWDW